jgi:hypothetical protein
MSSYSERLQARKNKYLFLAQKAKKESDNTADKAVEAVKGLQGEPVKMYHHSAKKHIKLLEKSDSLMRKAVELHEKAQYYENKSKGVGAGGISVLDEECLDKLKERLQGLEDSASRSKEANKLLRKSTTKQERIAILSRLSISTEEAEKMLSNWEKYYSHAGAFKLNVTSFSAEIRRLRARITTLEKVESVSSLHMEHDDFTYTESLEEKRVNFVFSPGVKPTEEQKALLKKNAFKWSPSRKAWTRIIANFNAINSGREVYQQLLQQQNQ